MIYFIYPLKDATITSQFPEDNFGLDEILEISRIVLNPSQSFISRALLHFDVNKFKLETVWPSIANSAKFYLKMHIANQRNVPYKYVLEARPLGNFWEMGTGKKFSEPPIRNGVSWKYTNGETLQTTWSQQYPVEVTESKVLNLTVGGPGYFASGSLLLSSSTMVFVHGIFNNNEFEYSSSILPITEGFFNSGSYFYSSSIKYDVTGSFTGGLISGSRTYMIMSSSGAQGGSFFNYLNFVPVPYGTQSFEGLSGDLTIEVTSIVQRWMEDNPMASMPNYGFIVKYSDLYESSSNNKGILAYYSVDTNSFYPPKLMMCWNDAIYVPPTSSEVLDLSRDFSLSIVNLKENYKRGSRVRFKLSTRYANIVQTFSSSINYLATKTILPEQTCYGIKFADVDDFVIPFSDEFTRVSCNENGNYFNVWFDNFMPERVYKLVFRVSDGNNVIYVDNNFNFRITR